VLGCFHYVHIIGSAGEHWDSITAWKGKIQEDKERQIEDHELIMIQTTSNLTPVLRGESGILPNYVNASLMKEYR
jgi:hypothetical protein